MYGATARDGYQLTQTKTYQATVMNDDSVFEYEMVLKVEGQQSIAGIHDSAMINFSSISFPDGQILGNDQTPVFESINFYIIFYNLNSSFRTY